MIKNTGRKVSNLLEIDSMTLEMRDRMGQLVENRRKYKAVFLKHQEF